LSLILFGAFTMPSPFPGMNPYLEHPSLWAGIHHRLITAIANDLAPQLRPTAVLNWMEYSNSSE